MNDAIHWVLFTKRTDYPKLGYILHRLKELAIACRFGNRTWHADLSLYVDKDRESDAWALLSERHGRFELDDIRDDHPKFKPFASEQPTHDWAGRPIVTGS
jgi:hypothetical protein